MSVSLCHPVVIVFGTAAAVAIAGQEIQAPVWAFDDVPQSAKLPIEMTFDLFHFIRIVGVEHDAESVWPRRPVKTSDPAHVPRVIKVAPPGAQVSLVPA